MAFWKKRKAKTERDSVLAESPQAHEDSSAGLSSSSVIVTGAQEEGTPTSEESFVVGEASMLAPSVESSSKPAGVKLTSLDDGNPPLSDSAFGKEGDSPVADASASSVVDIAGDDVIAGNIQVAEGFRDPEKAGENASELFSGIEQSFDQDEEVDVLDVSDTTVVSGSPDVPDESVVPDEVSVSGRPDSPDDIVASDTISAEITGDELTPPLEDAVPAKQPSSLFKSLFPQNSVPGAPELSAEEKAKKEKDKAIRSVFESEASVSGEDSYSKAIAEAKERWKDLPEVPADPELAELRTMLVAREIAILEQFKALLDDPYLHAKDISSVIAEALLLRSSKDKRLWRVLEPIVGDILKTVLRKNPIEFANIIFPLMGPAIRRSIAEAFRSMLESFNKSIEIAFSWKGLKWRVEALRTGKPFSEVVLLHNLIYRVDQVFLIHSETGLVLGHIVNEGIDSQDADMVSAMLTAVQDFVRDCFAGGNEAAGELESLQLGDSIIMVEKNPYASLACIVRGQPPGDFRDRMRQTLELLLIQYAEPLADFKGDTSEFADALPYLHDCVSSRAVDEGKPLPLWVRMMPATVVICLILLFGGWQYSRYSSAKDLENYNASMNEAVSLLRKTDGLMITGVVAKGKEQWDVICFKDELAPSPEDVLKKNGFDPERFDFTIVPSVSYAPTLVTKRVHEAIHPPATVSMDLGADGTLSLSGTAPMDWILQAREKAMTLPGVKSVTTEDLTDPRMAQITELLKEIESTVVEFPLGKEAPVGIDEQKLLNAVSKLVELEKLAKDMGIAVDLTVYGHADSVGTEKRNYEISQARARTIAAMLYAKGSSIPISLYGMGSEYQKTGGHNATSATEGDQASRRIELRVHLRQAADATPEVLKK